MEEIKTVERYAEMIKKPKTMVYFTASWCPDCFFIKPHLASLEEEYNEYTWITVDRDQHIELCQHLGILGIPSFIAYENGAERGRFVSKMRKTKEEVIAFIESLN